MMKDKALIQNLLSSLRSIPYVYDVEHNKDYIDGIIGVDVFFDDANPPFSRNIVWNKIIEIANNFNLKSEISSYMGNFYGCEFTAE